MVRGGSSDIAQLRALNHEILHLIKIGEFDKAMKSMGSISQSSQSGKRMVAHLRGKIAVVQQEFTKAIDIFTEALQEFGPHIILTADLAAAYYLDGQYGQWYRILKILESQFQEHSAQVDIEIRDRVALLISKFLEETGDINGSRLFLKLAGQSENSLTQQKSMVHLLRLESQYHLCDEWMTEYQSLKQVNAERENKEYTFELVHALAIAEAEASTPQLAYLSLRKVTNTDEISKRLIYFDLAEIEYRKTGSLTDAMLQTLRNIGSHHLYEEKLLQVFSGAAMEDWYDLSSKMPLGNYLRLLSLLLSTSNFKESELALYQWKLLVGKLSKKNQNTWNRLLDNCQLSDAQINIRFEEPSKLWVNNASVDLASKRLLLEFTKNLLRHKIMSEEEICLTLWNSEVSESYSARVRQLVSRLNKMIFKSAAVEICEHSFGKVSLRSAVTLNE
jgi:hypothetical protein